MALGLYELINNINKQIKAICCKIENFTPGEGGSSIWGSITGTLSSQTDLQNALNAKILTALPWSANHINATGNPYLIGDVVYYSGNIYRCIANNDGIIPTSTSYWINLGAGQPLVQEPVDWNTTSGNNQILNKPVIPAAQIQSDWTQTNNTALDFIKNKPTIPATQVNSDWNASSGVAEILNKPIIPDISTKQDTLVSGTNIKTIGGESILGPGNIEIPTSVGEKLFLNQNFG